jgi:hypothetical protein
MHRLIPLVLILAAPAAHAAERAFPVPSFDRLSARGSAAVVVRTGATPSVVASGDPRDLDRLEIEVVNGELRTGMKKISGWNWSASKTPLTIVVTTPGLRSVALAGSGDVDVDRVSGQAFAASLAGSGDLRLRQLDSADVRMNLAGSGDVTAAGRCRSAEMSIAGSGDIRAGSLRCEAVRLSVVGSGGLDAYATRSADVSVMGSGDVTVAGGAACKLNKRGSGTIRCG